MQGRQHPLTARALASLAGVLSREGRPAEAEELLREALEIQEATLGPSHPNVATTLDRLGEVLTSQREYAEASKLTERALAIQREVYGQGHVRIGQTLSTLARLRTRMGNFAEAIRLMREALETYEAAVGPERGETNFRRAWLCELLLDRERVTEALGYCERAHALYETLRPAGHVQRHWTTQLMAQAHIGLRNYALADSLLAASRAGLDAGEGNDNQRERLDSLQAQLDVKRQ
jgi:tetratricopeptide (TPR) repeat protein